MLNIHSASRCVRARTLFIASLHVRTYVRHSSGVSNVPHTHVRIFVEIALFSVSPVANGWHADGGRAMMSVVRPGERIEKCDTVRTEYPVVVQYGRLPPRKREKECVGMCSFALGGGAWPRPFWQTLARMYEMQRRGTEKVLRLVFCYIIWQGVCFIFVSFNQ